MDQTRGNSYEARIGDNANMVAVGSGISQSKSEVNIDMGGLLRDYLTPPANPSGVGLISRLDWITIITAQS